MNPKEQEVEPACCPKCGSKFHRTIRLCPRCVLSQAVDSISPSDHPSLSAMAIHGRSPTLDSLNSQFSDFEFHELLGRGGSGWTFRATQKSLSRSVAIKLISKTNSRSEALQRFHREAGILAQLNHRGIVTVHDFGEKDQFLYIVMEYIPGGMTLRRLISAGKVEPEKVVKIGSQLCNALEYAHAKGLVHRDIKPENILVASTEPEIEIRLADFGISRMAINSDSIDGLTQTGLIIGTPFYMAPEQQVPGKSIDRRTDVFSIGVVLYELLTGQLPQGNFQPPSKLSRCNPTTDHPIMKSLCNDPDQRFETAASLGEALVSSHESSRWRLVWPAVGLLLVIGALSLFVWIFDPGSAADHPTETNETNPFILVDESELE